MKKRILSVILSAAMVFAMTACGDSAAGGDVPEELAGEVEQTAGQEEAQPQEAAAEETAGAGEVSEPAPAAEGGALSVSLATEPDSLDPALSTTVDGGTMLVHLFSGLAKWTRGADGGYEIVADAATELPEGSVSENGTVTYTYTLRDGLVWSDGEPVTANDFVFAWNRAASVELASDYGYMFDVIDGYSEDDPDAKLNVTAIDDKTLEVVAAGKYPYWNELLAFPVYFPVREDVVSNDTWATDPSTYVCNGAYRMSEWNHNSVIKIAKNPDYHDAGDITMDEIDFYLSDDANNMLTNFVNGDWKLVDDVPTNEIVRLKKEYPDNFKVDGQIGTYYVCWNVNEELLPKSSTLTGVEAEKAREEIRKAISLLFDRNYIVESISQGGEVPASSFVPMGLTDSDGNEFYKNAGTSSYDGYFDVSEDALSSNYDAAMEVLRKYYTYDEAAGVFTDVPAINYIYNTSDNHKAIAEYIQGALMGIGITVNLENQEWATFLNTRKNGGYTLARNGWIADYNDPICFLDLWVSASGNNDVQYGKGDHASLKNYSLDLTGLGYDTKVENGTWAETYDVLISIIKRCEDVDKRYEMMHMAEDMIMSTGCICPLYFYTDVYMVDEKLQGFFSNPLGYKFFMYSHY